MAKRPFPSHSRGNTLARQCKRSIAMKILGMGTPELLIILVVVLLILGPKNLPKLGSAIGKSMKGLREGLGSGKKAEEASDEKEVAENLV